VEYGQVRLWVKERKIEKLELLFGPENIGTSKRSRGLKQELSEARLSAEATRIALKNAGVEVPL